MPRGVTWLDTGTPDSLSDANEFVKVIEKRTNKKIACIEEVAFAMGYIKNSQLLKIISVYGNSTYGEYLKRLIKYI